MQALEEIGPEAARVHLHGDLIGRSQFDGGRMHYSAWLRADPGQEPIFWGAPVIDLKARTWSAGGVKEVESTLRLTPSAARTLARQLVHLADLADLEA